MRKTTSALLILGALLSFTACGPKPAADETPAMAPPPPTTVAEAAPVLTWKSFQDPAGRFTLDLPGEPVERSASRRTGGDGAKEQSFLIDLGGRTFGVSITVFSPEFMKDALEGQMLASARKAAAAEIDGTVTEDKPVTMASPDGLAKLNGRQVIVESDSMKMVSRNHWLMNNGTLYRIMQSGPTDSTQAADFERMVKSFTLLAAPPAP